MGCAASASGCGTELHNASAVYATLPAEEGIVIVEVSGDLWVPETVRRPIRAIPWADTLISIASRPVFSEQEVRAAVRQVEAAWLDMWTLTKIIPFRLASTDSLHRSFVQTVDTLCFQFDKIISAASAAARNVGEGDEAAVADSFGVKLRSLAASGKTCLAAYQLLLNTMDGAYQEAWDLMRRCAQSRFVVGSAPQCHLASRRMRLSEARASSLIHACTFLREKLYVYSIPLLVTRASELASVDPWVQPCVYFLEDGMFHLPSTDDSTRWIVTKSYVAFSAYSAGTHLLEQCECLNAICAATKLPTDLARLVSVYAAPKPVMHFVPFDKTSETTSGMLLNAVRNHPRF